MATYTGTPRTWVAGETVTAALMNSDVRDPLAALAGAWTTYSPTIDQGATANIAHTATYAKYVRVGKLVIATFNLSPTAAGTAGQWVLVDLPVTAATGVSIVGTGNVYDASTTTHYPCNLVVYSGSTQISFRRQDAVNATPGAWGVDPNLALASGDALTGMLFYEAA